MRWVYYPEMDALVKRETGASRVVIFDHTLRHADRPQERGLRAPVQNVHNDYTEKSGPQRVTELLGEAEAAPLLKRRFAEYNVWRPIVGPVKSWPLALVDASTIAPQDLAACELVYQDRVGEIYIGVYSPAHAWLYVPEMRATRRSSSNVMIPRKTAARASRCTRPSPIRPPRRTRRRGRASKSARSPFSTDRRAPANKKIWRERDE